jgi:hypothetical protein
MDTNDLAVAEEALRKREGTSKHSPEHIGRWTQGDAEPLLLSLGAWATAQGVTSVLWTALPPKFAGKTKRHPKQK